EFLNKKIHARIGHCYKLDIELSDLQADKNTYEKFYQDKMLLEQGLGFVLSIENLIDFQNPGNVLCQLDITLRYELFTLATHYWEVTWLLESEALSSLPHDMDGRKKYWQIQSMLTPCFITTFHAGPGFFQYKSPTQEFETLGGMLDLLIIDEAGKVMPA